MTTRVTLAAGTFNSLEAAITAEGGANPGEIILRTELADLDVGLVTGGQTPTALPEINAAGVAVRVMKPFESTLEVWAHSVAGGYVDVETYGNPIIWDTTGVSSA